MALPRLIPREELFANPERVGARIAPDGSRLAWLAPVDGKLNVWVGAPDGSDGRPVTADTVRPITSFAWSCDSRYLLYVQDAGGDENFHLFAVDPTRSEPEARDLTPFEGARASLVRLPHRRPHEAFFSTNERDRSTMDLWRVDIGTGQAELVLRNDGRIRSWLVDDDGVLMGATAVNAEAGVDLLARDGDGWRTVRTYGAGDLSPFWPAPGGRLWAVSRTDERDRSAVVLIDMATGEETVVSSDPEDRVDAGGPVVRSATGELLAVLYVAERWRYEVCDPVVTEVLETAKRLHDGDPVLGSYTDDESRWLVTMTSDVDPGAVYLVDRNEGEGRLLFRPRPWLDPADLAPMQPVVIPSRDGLDLVSYLTLPCGLEPTGLPMVLVVHGGPWSRDMWGYNAEAQFFANRGYAVLQVNYRGSTGFGRRFYEAAIGQFGKAMQEDLLDAVDWAVAQGYADRSRIAVYGASYGGYATLSALAFHPDVFAAGVSYVGPSSLLTLMRSFPPYWAAFLRDTWHRFVGDPDDEARAAELEAVSPLYAVDRMNAPLLVVQGANDPRVTQQESDQMVAALHRRRVPVEYLLAPDEGHGFVDPVNRQAAYRAMELFLARHLGGRAEEECSPDVAARVEALRVAPEALGP